MGMKFQVCPCDANLSRLINYYFGLIIISSFFGNGIIISVCVCVCARVFESVRPYGQRIWTQHFLYEQFVFVCENAKYGDDAILWAYV
jgi:hypothetical protein